MNNYDIRKIRIVDKCCVILAMLAGFFLCVGTVILFANMMTRTVADVNISFTYELCGLCSAGVASFAIPFATFKAAHSQMDIITSHLPKRTRAGFEGVSGIITMVVMLFTVGVLLMYAYDRTLVMETTTTAGLPTWLFRWIFAIGMLITLIAAVVEMIDMFRIAAGKNVVLNSEEQASLEGSGLEAAGAGFVEAFTGGSLPENEEQDNADTTEKDGGEDK